MCSVGQSQMGYIQYSVKLAFTMAIFNVISYFDCMYL